MVTFVVFHSKANPADSESSTFPVLGQRTHATGSCRVGQVEVALDSAVHLPQFILFPVETSRCSNADIDTPNNATHCISVTGECRLTDESLELLLLIGMLAAQMAKTVPHGGCHCQ